MVFGSAWSKLEAVVVQTLKIWTVAVYRSMWVHVYTLVGPHGSLYVHIYPYMTMHIFFICIHSFGGFRDFVHIYLF